MSTTLLVAILATICIGAESSSKLNLTVQPERLLVEQGRQKYFNVVFVADAPDSSCVLECDGKTVPDIERKHSQGHKVVCSKMMTPRNVTQNCSVTASVIFNENATYSNSINFTVEKELKVNRSAVYGQEGHDVEFGQIHAPYDLPLKCIFNITPNDRYQQTGCSLKIQKTVEFDAVEHLFNICLNDSDESCVSGNKSLNVLTSSFDAEFGSFTLSIFGKSKTDDLDIRCVDGCSNQRFNTSEYLTNMTLFMWDRATTPVKIKIGDRMFVFKEKVKDDPDTIGRILIPVSVVIVAVILIVTVIVIVLLYKKEKLPCQNNGRERGDQELDKSSIPLKSKDES